MPLPKSYVENPDVQPSYLPAAWGGPFVWIRNEAGNLVLTKIADLTEKAKAALDALTGGVR